MRTSFTSRLIVGLLALALTGLLGCQSSRQPGSYSHASVTIRDQTEADISRMTQQVFAEDGFAPGAGSADTLVFEKLGSRADALKWGGLDGSGVVIRAKVKTRVMPDGSHLLQCDVFYVRHAGDSFLEDEGRMTLVRTSPYRRMLQEVAKRLGAN